MKLTVRMLFAFLLWLACLPLVTAGEFNIGGFKFALPDSWQAKTTQNGLIATRNDESPPKGDLLKIEFCVSTELKPCEAHMFYPPLGSNPENYFCGETKPTIAKHTNGLDEVRKTCSVKNASGHWQIGMLYLTHKQRGLALGLFTSARTPAPPEFLNAFVSSVVLQ